MGAEWALEERDAPRALERLAALPRILRDGGMADMGDLGFDVPETEDDDESRLAGKEGYAAFLDALITETETFGGQVVLVHGDTHFFKVDKPLPNAFHMLPNFTRVQTFGSPNVHWIKVDVDASTRDVFTFRPMIVAANSKKSLSN